MAVEAANGTAYFPSPKAGELTSPDGVNYSTLSTDSPFGSGADRQAIIYSITVGSTGTFQLDIKNYDDSSVLWSLHGSSSSRGYSFGPEGVRLPHGFCLNFDTGSGSVVVAYEIE